MDNTSFYSTDKGLWDRYRVTFHNRETTAQGLDLLASKALEVLIPIAGVRNLVVRTKILGGKFHPHPGIPLRLTIVNAKKLLTIGD